MGNNNSKRKQFSTSRYYSSMDDAEIGSINFEHCPSKCVSCPEACAEVPIGACREHLSGKFD